MEINDLEPKAVSFLVPVERRTSGGDAGLYSEVPRLLFLSAFDASTCRSRQPGRQGETVRQGPESVPRS